MGIGACRQGLGGVSNQAVDAYLVDAGAVQQGNERVSAVVRRVIGCDSNSLQSGFELFGICSGCSWAAINGKQDPVIRCKPVFHKATYLRMNGNNTIFTSSSLQAAFKGILF